MLHFSSQSNVFYPANLRYSSNIGKGAPVHVAAVLEFLSNEMFELFEQRIKRKQEVATYQASALDDMQRVPRAHPISLHARIVHTAGAHV